MSTSAWDDVRRLADEVRVKMHLAGMELKEKWKSLEPQIQELETKAKAGGEKAGDVITAQVSALAAGLKQFAEELGDAVTPGKKKSDDGDDKPPAA